MIKKSINTIVIIVTIFIILLILYFLTTGKIDFFRPPIAEITPTSVVFPTQDPQIKINHYMAGNPGEEIVYRNIFESSDCEELIEKFINFSD